MSVISAWKLDRDEARALLANQEAMSDAQRAFVRECPHLIYVVPMRRPISRARKLAVYERDGRRCAYCGISLGEREFTIDHRIPVARDGGDEPENLTCCCARCNRAKSTLTDAEFMAQ